MIGPGPSAIAVAIRRAKILIVDDKPANVELLTRMLAGAGYTGVSSTLDPATVQPLHAEHRYDLILLDLQMPGMDGFEVLERLKGIETDGYVPVLVITAQPDQKLRALRAGAKDFIGKPYDIAEVLIRVQNMLEVRLLHLEVRRKNDELRRLFDEVVAERRVSERLALQVPPTSIAARLPVRPDVTSEPFAHVTVVVADVVGFSNLSPAATPAELTVHLDDIFGAFDGLVQARGIRKIKTLGNSYMAAAGVPLAVPDHAVRAAHAALDMVDAVGRHNARTDGALQARVGIATGSVVAGVIGKRMYIDDIWGDAVNIAARMESHGVAGRVQASDATKALLGDGFLMEARGVLAVEGLGDVPTWFVDRRGQPAES